MSKTLNDKKTIIQIIYILYLLSFLTFSSTGLIGVAMALLLQEGSNDVELAQFKYQISIFWKYLVTAIIGYIAIWGVITIPLAIIIFLGLALWTVYKIVKGFQYLNKNEVIPL